jgi:hypothetical protein
LAAEAGAMSYRNKLSNNGTLTSAEAATMP